ncbi:2OG-Fe(II) oxygenase [Rapidithrix thailandica]|uniref:2OG-Fe(II) oxygenase n=1 Tax=Rapidithrix thailandica TaxID=413964 RepID=A0AAW9SAJ0_9BACT
MEEELLPNENTLANLTGDFFDSLAFQGYALVKDFLTPEEVQGLQKGIFAQYEQGLLDKAGIGKDGEHHVNKQVRGDLIQWIDSSVDMKELLPVQEKLKALRERLNRECFLSLKEVEMHFAMYPEGTFYKRHKDQFKQDDHRKITFICYLNPYWEAMYGGALQLYLPQKDGTEQTIQVLPEAGKLICFRSDLLEHEVLPTNRQRYSLTGWFLDQLKEVYL